MPATSAYPAPLAVLLPPVGGGGEVGDDNFDNNKETKEVELVAANDDVVILRNVRRWSNACAQRYFEYCIPHTLLPSSPRPVDGRLPHQVVVTPSPPPSPPLPSSLLASSVSNLALAPPDGSTM